MPFFVASVPFDTSNSSRNARDQFVLVCSKLQNSVRPEPFEVPPLKVGTLDNLLECSDDLVKLDGNIEAMTFKTLSALCDVAGGHPSDNAVVAVSERGQQTTVRTTECLAKFKWNEAQFPITKSLKQLLQSIQEQVLKGEETVRTRMLDYNEIKSKLQGIKKKSGGSLSVRPIVATVRKWYKEHNEEGPVESEYLTTVFVAVPNQLQKQFLESYATFGKCAQPVVVPDSAKLVDKDGDYFLYNPVLFQKFKKDFETDCRERKFIVREYNPEEEVTDAEVEELNQQLDSKKSNLVVWLKNTFSESYSAWMHLKAIRIFVESCLKYGLPPNFVALCFHVNPRQEKTVRADLMRAYASLSPGKFSEEEKEENSGALEHQFPYVSLRVKATPDD